MSDKLDSLLVKMQELEREMVPELQRKEADFLYKVYLNFIEKLNCQYCAYGNGVLAYVVEVAGRTEQYWCPVKHALRMKSMHSRYKFF